MFEPVKSARPIPPWDPRFYLHAETRRLWKRAFKAWRRTVNAQPLRTSPGNFIVFADVFDSYGRFYRAETPGEALRKAFYIHCPEWREMGGNQVG